MAIKKSTKKYLKSKLKSTVNRRDQPKTFKKKPSFNKSDNKQKEIVQHHDDDDEQVYSSSDDDEQIDPELDTFVGGSEQESEEIESEDESDEEDEDDGEDEEELDESKEAKKERLIREAEEHKRQLLEMKEKDPEFFKYLQENDANLLKFGESDDEDEPEEDEEMMQDDEEEEEEGIPVTREMIQNWKSLMSEKQSLPAAKQVLMAFKSAVIAGETESEETQDMYLKYVIEDTAIFNLVVMATMHHVPQVLYSFLNIDPSQTKRLPSTSNKWKKGKRVVKNFVSYSVKLLKQVTDASVLSFIMSELAKAIPLFACFPKVCRQLVKHSIAVWTGTDGVSDEKVRIHAFLTLRKLASEQSASYLDMILKSCYLAFQNSCKMTAVHTMPSIQFLMNCLVELYGLKCANAYHFGFVYIRQLAILLRNAITNKTKESFKKIYNWQFLHCADVWSRILSGYCDLQTGVDAAGQQAMRQLIYPLVQVMLGVMSLKPSSKYFPFRFHCLRILMTLCKKTGTFIPLGSLLLDVFDAPDVKHKPKPSTIKPIELTYLIKVPNNYVRTRPYQVQLIDETTQLMFEYYSSFGMHIGFPELAIPAIFHLKKLTKQIKNNMHFSKHVGVLVDKLQENSSFIEQRRNHVEFSPRDMEQCQQFLAHIDANQSPLIKYMETRKKFKQQMQEGGR